MRDIVSFPLLLAGFAICSAGLHWLVISLGIAGLAAFLVYCMPMMLVIAYTTAKDGENFFESLLRVALWGYSFIIAIAAVAWTIGEYVS
jgi:Flp pilus assembly protein TadB